MGFLDGEIVWGFQVFVFLGFLGLVLVGSKRLR